MPHAWSPPEGWVRITSIDAHTAGEPLRVITGGLPQIHGSTILEKRRYAKENLDLLHRKGGGGGRIRTLRRRGPPYHRCRLHHGEERMVDRSR